MNGWRKTLQAFRSIECVLESVNEVEWKWKKEGWKLQWKSKVGDEGVLGRG